MYVCVCNEALACERRRVASSTGDTFDLSSVPRCGRESEGWKNRRGGSVGGFYLNTSVILQILQYVVLYQSKC